jgi:hypothetical protein
MPWCTQFSLPHLLHAAEKKPTCPKSAVLVFLSGGPSHIDMYDPKPDAPAEYRDQFKSISMAWKKPAEYGVVLEPGQLDRWPATP